MCVSKMRSPGVGKERGGIKHRFFFTDISYFPSFPLLPAPTLSPVAMAVPGSVCLLWFLSSRPPNCVSTTHVKSPPLTVHPPVPAPPAPLVATLVLSAPRSFLLLFCLVLSLSSTSSQRPPL